MTNSTGVHFSETISSGHPRAPISWIKSTKINSKKIKSTKSAAIFFVAPAARSIVFEDESKWHPDGVDIARLNAVDQSIKITCLPFWRTNSPKQTIVQVVQPLPYRAVRNEFFHLGPHANCGTAPFLSHTAASPDSSTARPSSNWASVAIRGTRMRITLECVPAVIVITPCS